jgi:hypothetical protein
MSLPWIIDRRDAICRLHEHPWRPVVLILLQPIKSCDWISDITRNDAKNEETNQHLILVHLRHRPSRTNFFVHERLRERRFIKLVVSPDKEIKQGKSVMPLKKSEQLHHRRYTKRSTMTSCKTLKIQCKRRQRMGIYLAEVASVFERCFDSSGNIYKIKRVERPRFLGVSEANMYLLDNPR